MISISLRRRGVLEKLSETDEKGESLWSLSWLKFRRNRMAFSSMLVIIALYLVSGFAGYLAPYSFDDGDLYSQNLPPTWYRYFMSEEYLAKAATVAASADDFLSESTIELVAGNVFESPLAGMEPSSIAVYLQKDISAHLMGTDEIGQDIFSRVIYGMRLSLLLALTVTFVSVLIGVVYGATAGFVGGWLDSIMMRFVDFLFGIPFIFLVILLMVFFGREIYLIFIGLGLVYWIVLARIVRGQVLSIKQQDYIAAARTAAVPEWLILFKHLIPNAIGPVVVFSTLLVPQIMLLEAFLSFIGLGVSPPEVSLGILIADGASVISSYTWPIIFPGLVFSLLIFCMNFIGDGLRDALDPKTLT